jgi:hypothetical protein
LGLEWDKCEQLRKGFANRLFDEGRNIGIARNFTTETGADENTEVTVFYFEKLQKSCKFLE